MDHYGFNELVGGMGMPKAQFYFYLMWFMLTYSCWSPELFSLHSIDLFQTHPQ